MEVFQQQPKLLETNEAKKIIKNFNKLAKVLLEFEVLYHRGWLRQVRVVPPLIVITYDFLKEGCFYFTLNWNKLHFSLNFIVLINR